MGTFKNIWNRKKDGNSRELRSFIRVAIISLAMAVVFLFAKKDNVIRWVEAGVTINRQNREIRANNRRIARMQQRLEDLTTNRDSLEKYAREKFHFKEKGDDIYLVP